VKAERSRHVVLVSPPALERMEKVWELIDRNAIVVCADHEQATHWADVAPAEYRAHAVTGLTRTAALLKEGRIGLLAGSPADLAALVARSALKLDTLAALVIGWPEGFGGELDSLLAEAPNARRIVLSWNPPALADFLERHARRAEVVGNLPLDPDGKPRTGFKTPAQGAATSVWAATAPELEGRGGRYLEDCQEGEPVRRDVPFAGYHPHARDAESAKRLWTVSEQMIGETIAV